jgi:hypothetical protein
LDCPLVVVLLGGAVLALGLFVIHEARSTAPFLPLRIVLDSWRGSAYASAGLAIAGMFGAALFLTYELRVALGVTPYQAGMAFLPMSASSFLAATIVAPRVLPRIALRAPMVPGFLAAALGMAILSQLQPASGYLSGVLPAEILLGLGIACVMVPASSLATSRVDSRDAGVASAALNSAQQIGASLGIAVPTPWRRRRPRPILPPTAPPHARTRSYTGTTSRQRVTR